MIVLYIATAVVYLLFLALTVVKAMHMFQLNSYKPATHFRWLKGNLASLLPGAVGAVAALALLLNVSEMVTLCVVLAVFAVLCLVQRPKKAKKPLLILYGRLWQADVLKFSLTCLTKTT